MNQRVNEGVKVLGALRKVWKERFFSRSTKMGMFEDTVIPTILYGCEAWTTDEDMQRKVDV